MKEIYSCSPKGEVMIIKMMLLIIITLSCNYSHKSKHFSLYVDATANQKRR